MPTNITTSIKNTPSFQAQQRLSELFTNILSIDENAKIVIEINLNRGIPFKDIHKIGGPCIDEWATQQIMVTNQKQPNEIGLYDFEEGTSGTLHDVKFKLKGIAEVVNVDFKSACLDKGKAAGKGSNLTSYRKIRPFYVNNSEAIFLFMAFKYRSFTTGAKRGGFIITGFSIFDLKYVASDELFFNRRMGDQFQIKDSANVRQVYRSGQEFISMIDLKYQNAYSESEWNTLAKRYKWNLPLSLE